MKYTQLTDQDVRTMLGAIGAASVEELFTPIPPAHRMREPLDIPPGVSEAELLEDIGRLASKNHSCQELVCFAGAGAYDHFIPTAVDALASQTEFVTAYTPYQAEASQGMLQLLFEFQTMICELFGMDVANASLYEGATAAAEAVAMAAALTNRSHLLVSATLHPDTIAVLQTRCRDRDVHLTQVPARGGAVDEDALGRLLSDQHAALVVQSPNFLGCLERLDRMVPVVHQHGALAIVSTDPLASGMFQPPGRLGADIVVGEGQALGTPLQYGGPYLGLLACREKFLRRMPGRVVGQTLDLDGRRGFCLALQTREQHIKRERATSNVCTNQGLLAVRASLYLSALGRTGLREVANQCFDKAHDAARRIEALPGYELPLAAPYFKEFVVRTDRGVERVLAAARSRGILAGVPLARFADFTKDYEDCFLVAVTEKRTRAQIDALVAALEAA